MAGVLVDANVLLDILTADPLWLARSAAELRQAKAGGEVLVNPIICAEIAPAFDFNWPRIEVWLARAGILTETLPFAAAAIAAAAHREYRQRGGTRTSPLPDFYIGARLSELPTARHGWRGLGVELGEPRLQPASAASGGMRN